ncbi:MAG: POTRA domain-containing protein [Niabella sp.]
MLPIKANKYRILLPLLFACVFCNAQVSDFQPDGHTNQTTAAEDTAATISLPVFPDSIYAIQKITIEGNMMTRRPVILRELPFREGDSIKAHDIPEKIAHAQRQVKNLAMFHEVAVSIDSFAAQDLYIKITVKERWYIWPIPHFKPIDRNINQWLKEKADLNRVDYGIKLLYDNVTGYNDKLRFYLITGYTKQMVLRYSAPIDKEMHWGSNLNLAFGKNREVLYNTLHDKQEFLKSDKYIKKFFDGTLELTYRPKIFTKHTFGIGYHTLNIGDTVLKANPIYFLNGQTKVKYPSLYYILNYQNLDYIPYPTSGYAAEVEIEKRGFDKNMDMWYIGAKGLGYWNLPNRFFYSLMVSGIFKLPTRQPYPNLQLTGYGDVYLSGYEDYVVDGNAALLVKGSLFRQLTSFKIPLPKTKFTRIQGLPFKIYGKVFANLGYVDDRHPHPTNKLSNRTLFGYGAGFDIFTAYDMTLKIEFSYNHLGQNGVYLHKKEIF